MAGMSPTLTDQTLAGDAVRNIPLIDAADDCPHAPTADPSFQESALFVWHDLAAGIGGFWRIGQEPVIAALNSCFGLFAADGLRFRSNVTGVPMQRADRGTTHMGWGAALRVDLDTLAIKADFPECQAVLRFQDFFPRYNWFALQDRKVPQGHSAHHFEVAGRMSGRVCLGGRELSIDALGYRDRSWGARQWSGLRGTRWWPSVYGPDQCAFISASVHESGHHGAYGYIIRDGAPHTLRSVDVTATLDYDALSPRSGWARATLDSGEVVELQHQCSDGIVQHTRGYTAVESIGTARWGNRIGMSNFEVCTNAAGGDRPPVLALRANNGEGLSRR
jgi:hypothetical protein